MKARTTLLAAAAASLLAASAQARSNYRIVDGNRVIGGVNYGPERTIANGNRPRPGVYPGGCVPPLLRARSALRALNRSAFLAERQGVMTRPARFELTKQAATIYGAVKQRGASPTAPSTGARQLGLLDQLTRHVRSAPGGRVDEVGLRSFVLHGRQVRFATTRGGIIGTSESFLKGIPQGPSRVPTTYVKGVKTTSTLGGSSVQLETLSPTRLGRPGIP